MQLFFLWPLFSFKPLLFYVNAYGSFPCGLLGLILFPVALFSLALSVKFSPSPLPHVFPQFFSARDLVSLGFFPPSFQSEGLALVSMLAF